MCCSKERATRVYIWLKTPESCKALHSSDAAISYLTLADVGQSWGKSWLSAYSILPPQCNAHPAFGIVRRSQYKDGSETSVALGDSFSFFLELLLSQESSSLILSQTRTTFGYTLFVSWCELLLYDGHGEIPVRGGYYERVHIVRSADWFVCILRLSSP